MYKGSLNEQLGRIIRGIKAESLVSCFINFANGVRQKEGREHISFGGKVVCGSKHGDYVLQVKKNQGKLLKEIEAFFTKLTEIHLND